jgi:hypothetical protein
MTHPSLGAAGPGPDTSPAPIAEQRRRTLSVALPIHIELLRQRRAGDVPQADLDGYIALGWMRWAGSRIVVTPQGSAMRDVVVASEERRVTHVMQQGEKDELHRQGAKAAARGEGVQTNPLLSDRNGPAVTGEAPGEWRLRALAWEAGFESQAAAGRMPDDHHRS